MVSRDNENYDYLRVRISGELWTESFLHCGDGSDLPAKEWDSEKQKGEKGRINTVFKGVSPNNG